ncbi:MAG TPA: hypothetical protein VHB47_22920 [Thermoanaerobaculia bacterium]|nr:hypothetical protein [Thermoanaerobaculia bacterium]
MSMPLIGEVAAVQPAPESFVINNGRYFTGTQREYFPEVKHAAALPSSSLLAWALEQQGASAEHARLLRALQRYTGVNCSCWGFKNLGSHFAFELYMVIYPPLHRHMLGRDVAERRLSEHETNLNFFLGFEQAYFGQPSWGVDPSSFGLGEPLYILSFDLDERIFEQRRIDQYTMATRSTERPMPERPAEWDVHAWNKGEEKPIAEQHGCYFEPDRHREAMMTFIDDCCRLRGWPGESRPDAREFLVPWLFEHARSEFHLLGLARKELHQKGGLGVYYRLRYPALVRFAEEYGYPMPFVRQLIDHRELLEHLVFDVALGYRIYDGSTAPWRAAIYGTV